MQLEEANSKSMTSMISMGSKTLFLLPVLHAKKCFENVRSKWLDIGLVDRIVLPNYLAILTPTLCQ